MNKFDQARETLAKAIRIVRDKKTGEYSLISFDAGKVKKAMPVVAEALTQAAEIERGDKVVVPREPTDEMINACANFYYAGRYSSDVHKSAGKHFYKAMITASEGKDDE